MADLIIVALVLACAGIPCALSAIPERTRVSLACRILGDTSLVVNTTVSAHGIGIYVPSSAISVHIRNVRIYNVVPSS